MNPTSPSLSEVNEGPDETVIENSLLRNGMINRLSNKTEFFTKKYFFFCKNQAYLVFIHIETD